jgi:Ca-activated chloride channel family protein
MKSLIGFIATIVAAASMTGFWAGCAASKAPKSSPGATSVVITLDPATRSVPIIGNTGTRPQLGVGGGGIGGGGASLGLQNQPAIPGSLPSREEEIWVIVRTSVHPVKTDSGIPGCGAMFTQLPKEEKEVPLPLKHTAVKAWISAYIATVEVTQQFHNPYDGKVEAVYVFPLPENAAVNEFLMIIGERRIRGLIRERQEAEQIYQEAKRGGYVASLLTQERPNVFTQSVANIEPGKQIDIQIRYFHTLAYQDGWYEFVFPMVVGPRFNPPGSAGGIAALSRTQSGRSGQKTDVRYLRPGERSGHDISLQVDVRAGVAIEEFECRSHVITSEKSWKDGMAVTLSPNDTIPNKDFVLRYRVAGDRIKSNLLTHRDERGGFFTLMIYPPRDLEKLPRQPVEMVFVLDSSGSMSGRPIEQAKAAIERGLRLLQPGDSFQLINFANRASQLGPRPVEATPENVRRGLRYLKGLESQGGTMMIEGIKAALDFPHDPERLRFVCFMTDGYIGNETEILREVHKKLDASRVFSFGVGPAVNRYLLDGMAKLGRGAVAYLGPNDSAVDVMDQFFTRISHAALTDIQIDWGNMEVKEVFPRRIPDLFVGRPVILTGRHQGSGEIRITGKAGAQRVERRLAANWNDSEKSHSGLPSIWARMKISDLAAQSIQGRGGNLPAQVRQVALDYGLLSEYTAFLAVDSSRRTEGSTGTTVPVAVPVPEGVKYETTVGPAREGR